VKTGPAKTQPPISKNIWTQCKESLLLILLGQWCMHAPSLHLQPVGLKLLHKSTLQASTLHLIKRGNHSISIVTQQSEEGRLLRRILTTLRILHLPMQCNTNYKISSHLSRNSHGHMWSNLHPPATLLGLPALILSSRPSRCRQSVTTRIPGAPIGRFTISHCITFFISAKAGHNFCVSLMGRFKQHLTFTPAILTPVTSHIAIAAYSSADLHPPCQLTQYHCLTLFHFSLLHKGPRDVSIWQCTPLTVCSIHTCAYGYTDKTYGTKGERLTILRLCISTDHAPTQFYPNSSIAPCLL